jgi:transposase
MDKWQERGLVIAESNTVEKNKLGWKVPSQSGNGTYVVNLEDGEPFCTCQHFETTHKKCQHIYAVEFIEQREKRSDGTEVITKAVRVTYTQDWSVYNEVQTHEQEHFVALLRDLCNGIEQPEYRFGRPRLPLTDVVFGLVFKVYSTMSGRRFTCALKETESKGLIAKAAHYNSAFRYLESEELTPLLKSLIEQSASPLKAVETDFAVDSSGFSTQTYCRQMYSRWYDHKYGKRSRQSWVKTHLMCGVKTHIVTSAEATAYESSDTAQLISLLKTTANTFTINEVSADKAYSSRRNLHAIQAVGGTSYIPFKGNAKGMGSPTTGYDGLWHKMWHFYNFNREAFMQHYHKRSNIEATFSMIKAKFGSSVRSKSPIAQVNEVLCKVLCHNICVLIQSIYELGIAPNFWTFEAKEPITTKLLENMNF